MGDDGVLMKGLWGGVVTRMPSSERGLLGSGGGSSLFLNENTKVEGRRGNGGGVGLC